MKALGWKPGITNNHSSIVLGVTFMKRTFVTLFVLLGLVAGLFGYAMPAHAAGVNWFADPIFTDAGQTVTLNIKVDTDQPIIGWQADVKFNPSVVRLNSWTEDVSWFKAAALAAGGDTFRVAGTINNTAGSLVNASVAGLGFPASVGATGAGTIANLSFTALADGNSPITFENVCLVATNNTCISGATISASFIQVGAAPRLEIASINFTPTGNQGAQFKATITVRNVGSYYAGDDDLVWSITNATGGTPVSPIEMPEILAGASYSFDIVGFELDQGAQNAVLTASISMFGATASSTYSPVSSSGNTEINASVGAFLMITPDASVDFGSLALGNNTMPGNLNVKCNTNYQVDVYDNGSTNWQMTEWNGTGFGTRKLSETLKIASAQKLVTAGAPANLVIGGVAGQSGDAGQDYPLTYSQVLKYADPVLTAGSSYRLVLTFNGYVTL
jgi:hypothetical protein